MNELEKRGVELEMRLRKSEEGEIRTHLLYDVNNADPCIWD